jgi:hypothetical protein
MSVLHDRCNNVMAPPWLLFLYIVDCAQKTIGRINTRLTTRQARMTNKVDTEITDVVFTVHPDPNYISLT